MAAIGLVTILYKSAAQIGSFLDDLQAQELKEWRLYVVDNASPDHAARIVVSRADPRIVLLPNQRNLGFAAAANQGLRRAMADGCEFLILFNNDTAFAPDFLRRLVEIRTAIDASVIAPRVMWRDEPSKAWYAGGGFRDEWVLDTTYNIFDPSASQLPSKVDFAPGCCLGIGRRVFDQVGMFDERFFVYWEDADFCLRLRQAGIAVTYVPSLYIDHDGGASSGGSFSSDYSRLYYKSYVQFLQKHCGLRSAIMSILRILLVRFVRDNNGFTKMIRLAPLLFAGLVVSFRSARRL